MRQLCNICDKLMNKNHETNKYHLFMSWLGNCEFCESSYLMNATGYGSYRKHVQRFHSIKKVKSLENLQLKMEAKELKWETSAPTKRVKTITKVVHVYVEQTVTQKVDALTVTEEIGTVNLDSPVKSSHCKNCMCEKMQILQKMEVTDTMHDIQTIKK